MNKKHWRDAKDFFKAGFLHVLRSGKGVLNDLKVFPMFTGNSIAPDDVRAYAEFLGFAVGDVLNDAPFVPTNDQAASTYFANASKFAESDIFLDPDTGVADAGQTRSRSHVTVPQIQALLPVQSHRLLVVYQDSPDRSVKDQPLKVGVIAKLAGLNAAGLTSIAYFNNSTNVILIASPSGEGRLNAVRDYLETTMMVPSERLLRDRRS